MDASNREESNSVALLPSGVQGPLGNLALEVETWIQTSEF